jgi:hypothetical protein
MSILDAPALAISAGGLHTCAVMQDNSARCWGDNTFGQIGNGAISNSPVNRPATVIIGNNTLPNVMQIAAGERHTCALIGPLPPGIVACWGNGPDGELGRPGTTSAPVLLPQLVLDSSGNIFGGATDIAAGSHHTCARINDGTVQCWGSNSRGQLGQAVAVGANSVSPVTVTFDAAGNNPLSGVAHIAAGQNHTCATLAADGVRCWGDNSFGQLGASTAPNTMMSATPVAVTGVCTCPGLTSCNGQCADTTSDPQNCGGCFNACTGGMCVGGTCRCPPADGTLCPASGSSHVCADLTRDPNNCGACGRVCSGGTTCVSSVCVCEQTNCGGRCVDLQTDNNNCGRCGRRCRINPPCNRRESGCTTCENGDCVPF